MNITTSVKESATHAPPESIFMMETYNSTVNFTHSVDATETLVGEQDNDQNMTFLNEMSSQMDSSTNSTLLEKITTIVYGATEDRTVIATVTSAVNVTTDIDTDVTTAALDEAKFSDMEIWFIATGSVILAVIVLFCINTCIQCQVFEKLFKCFKRRNQMAQIERRSHKDMEQKYGQNDEPKTRTHMLLHRMLFRKQNQPQSQN